MDNNIFTRCPECGNLRNKSRIMSDGRCQYCHLKEQRKEQGDRKECKKLYTCIEDWIIHKTIGRRHYFKCRKCGAWIHFKPTKRADCTRNDVKVCCPCGAQNSYFFDKEWLKDFSDETL